MGRGNKKKGASVQISNEEYKKLLSRPKQSTLRKDDSIRLRKGKLGNPYSQTLLDPIRVTGVKVPDVTSFPTSTFQAYDRQDYTVAAHGTFGIAFQPVLYSFYAQCLNLDGATAYNNWSGQAQSTAMNGIYHSYRPVSACMRIWTNANATSNSGEIAAAYLAKDQTLAAGTMGTFDKIAKRFGSFRGPLREGLEILWMPQDATSRMYLLTATTTTNQAIGSNWPGMVAGISGATSGSVVSVEWYVNYEAIPEQSTFNLVNATAPYVNNGDLESATALISKLGSFARPLGQDLSSWVYSQGAVVAGEIGRHIAGRAIHYMSNRIGMGGRPSTSSILG